MTIWLLELRPLFRILSPVSGGQSHFIHLTILKWLSWHSLAYYARQCGPFIHSFIHSIIYLFIFVYLWIMGPSEPMLSEQIPDARTNIIPTSFLMLHYGQSTWYIWDLWHCSIAGCRLVFMVTHCLVLHSDWLGCLRADHTHTHIHIGRAESCYWLLSAGDK